MDWLGTELGSARLKGGEEEGECVAVVHFLDEILLFCAKHYALCTETLYTETLYTVRIIKYTWYKAAYYCPLCYSPAESSSWRIINITGNLYNFETVNTRKLRIVSQHFVASGSVPVPLVSELFEAHVCDPAYRPSVLTSKAVRSTSVVSPYSYRAWSLTNTQSPTKTMLQRNSMLIVLSEDCPAGPKRARSVQ
jgi:hypothetical protein